MRHALLATLLLAAPLPAAVPAFAQTATPGGVAQQNFRNFALQNETDRVITGIRVTSTNGGKELLHDDGQIQPRESHSLRVPRSECVGGVSVTFRTGNPLSASNLNACRNDRVVVQNDKIVVTNSAVR